MQNKKNQILEFGSCWHLSAEFILEMVRDEEIHHHTIGSSQNMGVH
jgi:hypothetical protein